VVKRLADSGARVHRVVISWQGFEPLEGRFNPAFWAEPDRNYRDDLAGGVRQIIVLEGTPLWALGPAGRGSASPDGGSRCDGGNSACNAPPNVRDPRIRRAWRGWVAGVARRYPRAAGIEIWNEPNIAPNWFQRQDPPLYGLMLKAAGEAIRATKSRTPVVSGSVSTFEGPNDPQKTGYADFLSAVYRSAGKRSFDAIGWHGYPCKESGSLYGEPERHLDAIRQVQHEFHDSRKPLWLTETGATTGKPDSSNCGEAFSEREQSEALAAVLDWATDVQRHDGDLPVVLVHSLFDWNNRQEARAGAGGGEFGLVGWSLDPRTHRVTTRAKPAYRAVTCRMKRRC
jgi:hypothetical protein